MQRSPLATSSISRLVLGSMNFGDPTAEADAFDILDLGVDGGVTTIDCADVYVQGRSEEIVGAWMAERPDVRVEILTKVGMPFGDVAPPFTHQRRHIVASCDASLRRLGIEQIDLYQLHKATIDERWPDVLGVFADLADAGKIAAFGTSSHPAWMLAEARQTHPGLVVSEQCPYNLLDRRVEREVIPWCRRSGTAVLAFSPLAAGLLAGRYRDADIPSDSRAARRPQVSDRINPEAREASDRWLTLAEEFGIDPAAAAVAWVAQRGGVSAVICGPRTLHHLRAALIGSTLTLSAEFLALADEICPGGSMRSDFQNTSGWGNGQWSISDLGPDTSR